MEPIVWLVITWATFSPHRTAAALEKVPQTSMKQCIANADRIKEWQPKASVICLDGASDN